MTGHRCALCRTDVHFNIGLHAVAVNQPAARRIVFRGCDPECAAVGERDNHLNGPFSECPGTDEHRPFVILQAGREDFRRACRVLVDQNRQRKIRILPAVDGVVADRLFRPALHGNHELLRRNETADRLHSGVQQTARIVPEIHNQSFRPLAFQLLHGLFDVRRRRCGKLRDPQIPDPVRNHRNGFDRTHRDFGARHGNLPGLIAFGPIDLQFEHRSRCPLHPAHAFRQRKRPRIISVDLHNDVSCPQTGLHRGGILHDGHNFQRIVFRGHHHADSGEFPAGVLHGGAEAFRFLICAERIQLLQHPAHRGAQKILIRDFSGVHILLPQQLQRLHENGEIPIRQIGFLLRIFRFFRCILLFRFRGNAGIPPSADPEHKHPDQNSVLHCRHLAYLFRTLAKNARITLLHSSSSTPPVTRT